MQHASLRQRRLTQQGQGVSARFAGVHNHRFAGELRSLQMQPKSLALQLGRFRLVVIVQTCFANGHHMGVIELGQQPIQRRRHTRLQVQRMHTHRAINIGIAFAQGLDRRRVVGTDANTQEVTNTAPARSRKRRIEGTAMGAQIETIKVTVGINQHEKTSGRGLRRTGSLGQLTLSAGGCYIVWVGRSDFRAPAR